MTAVCGDRSSTRGSSSGPPACRPTTRTTRFRSSRVRSTAASWQAWSSRRGCIAGIVVLWRRSPIAALVWRCWRRRSRSSATSSITIGTICAERLLYLPSAGAAHRRGGSRPRRSKRKRRRRRAACSGRGNRSMVLLGARADLDAQSGLAERTHALVVGDRRGPGERPRAVGVRPRRRWHRPMRRRRRAARQTPSATTRRLRRTSRRR